MLAGSAALPSAMSGCGPVALPFDLARPLTIFCAMERTSASEALAEALSARGGGRESGERTEKDGASSSRRVCARVPNSQLAGGQGCGSTRACVRACVRETRTCALRPLRDAVSQH